MKVRISSIFGEMETEETFCLAEASELLAKKSTEGHGDYDLWADIFDMATGDVLFCLHVEYDTLYTWSRDTGNVDKSLLFYFD